jgi:hypothetical protein
MGGMVPSPDGVVEAMRQAWAKGEEAGR